MARAHVTKVVIEGLTEQQAKHMHDLLQSTAEIEMREMGLSPALVEAQTTEEDNNDEGEHTVRVIR